MSESAPLLASGAAFPETAPAPEWSDPVKPTIVQSGPPITSHQESVWCTCTIVLNLVAAALLLGAVLVPPQQPGQASPLLIAFLVSYLLYIFTSLCSPSAKALRNLASSSEVLELTSALRRTKPDAWARIECYHYEERTRHVTHTDKDGNTHHSSETYTVKVVTHSARASWGYSSCTDSSGPPVYQPWLRVLQIAFEPVMDFDCPASFEAYAAWKRDFYDSNRRDAHQDTSSGMEVHGLIPHVMLRQTEACYLSPIVHVLCVLVGLGAVYELAVFQTVPQTTYKLVKVLGGAFSPPQVRLRHPHPLSLVYQEGRRCDLCGSQGKGSGPFMSCTSCGYDECRRCAKQ